MTTDVGSVQDSQSLLEGLRPCHHESHPPRRSVPRSMHYSAPAGTRPKLSRTWPGSVRCKSVRHPCQVSAVVTLKGSVHSFVAAGLPGGTDRARCRPRPDADPSGGEGVLTTPWLASAPGAPPGRP